MTFLKKNTGNCAGKSRFSKAENKDMSVKKQCDLLGISRTAYYYKQQTISEDKDLLFHLLLKISNLPLLIPKNIIKLDRSIS